MRCCCLRQKRRRDEQLWELWMVNQFEVHFFFLFIAHLKGSIINGAWRRREGPACMNLFIFGCLNIINQPLKADCDLRILITMWIDYIKKSQAFKHNWFSLQEIQTGLSGQRNNPPNFVHRFFYGIDGGWPSGRKWQHMTAIGGGNVGGRDMGC